MGQQNRRISEHSRKLSLLWAKKHGPFSFVSCSWITPHHTMHIHAGLTSPNTGTVLQVQISPVLVDSYRAKRDIVAELSVKIDTDLMLGL